MVSFKGKTIMIHVSKQSISEGSCNFCNRGQIAEDDSRMIYPYDFTYHLTGERGQISVRLCPECWSDLQKVKP